MTSAADSRIPRVVLDTNVLVSALNFGGRPRDVLELGCVKVYQLCLSSFILDELSVVLQQDFGWSVERVSHVIAALKAVALVVEPNVRLSVIKAKDDDNRILECAVTARAQIIVSGDKRHILPLKEWEGIVILSPVEFLRSGR